MCCEKHPIPRHTLSGAAEPSLHRNSMLCQRHSGDEKQDQDQAMQATEGSCVCLCCFICRDINKLRSLYGRLWLLSPLLAKVERCWSEFPCIITKLHGKGIKGLPKCTMTGTTQEGRGEPGGNFISPRVVAKHGAVRDQMDVTSDVLTQQSPWRWGSSFWRTKKRRDISGGRKGDETAGWFLSPAA